MVARSTQIFHLIVFGAGSFCSGYSSEMQTELVDSSMRCAIADVLIPDVFASILQAQRYPAVLQHADGSFAQGFCFAANKAFSHTSPRNARRLDSASILGGHRFLHCPPALSSTVGGRAVARVDMRGGLNAAHCVLRRLSVSTVDPSQDSSLKRRFQMMAKDYGKVIVVSCDLVHCPSLVSVHLTRCSVTNA